QAASQAWSAAYESYMGSERELDRNGQQRLDQLLYGSEQLFVGPGLPRRPWFRHQIYAPGLYTGYGVKTLPGVREAIEEGKWEEAQAQIEVTSAAISRFAERVGQAVKLLEP
ncbi:MAG: transferrin receptor-like dimerization domain-containing protein, partial [Acidobacteriota bacterium]